LRFAVPRERDFSTLSEAQTEKLHGDGTHHDAPAFRENKKARRDGKKSAITRELDM